MFRSLDSTRIIDTLATLAQRIEERFPGAGLSAVGRELLALGEFCAREADELGRVNWPVRIVAGVLIVGVVALSALLVLAPWLSGAALEFGTVGDYLQALEAAINEIVFLGVALWFLGSIEGRIKRRRALAAIHQLRSIAHVVDMHQLTKDPDQVLSGRQNTASSPERTMTRAQLGRYLDYCSELLSLASKVAALFVQRLHDPQVLAAVDEVTGLTNGLSQKIWQKLSILDAEGRRDSTSFAPPA